MNSIRAGLCLLPLLAVEVRAQTIERISVDSSGAEGVGVSFDGSVSADGRRVVFCSQSSSLVPGDTNGFEDAFLRDRATGTTSFICVSTAGVLANSASELPRISADGRYVTFTSHGSNLVAGDTNAREDVFLRDLLTNTTTRVSVSSAGAQASSGSSYGAISADGAFVAFASDAADLVAGDTNANYDVFVRDIVGGLTTRVSVATNGTQGNGPSSGLLTISGDGRYVAFYSWATNLVPGDTNGSYEPFVHDRSTGTTTRVAVDSGGAQGNGYSLHPTISADGRHVAFSSVAPNLVPGDTNGMQDVFDRDLFTGVTRRISVGSAGIQGNAVSGGWSSISGDGRYALYGSAATNLVALDTNVFRDVFVHDLATGQTSLVSRSASGALGNGHSDPRAISADGRFVCFESDASNLVLGDSNARKDIFLVDRFGFDPPVVYCVGDGSGTPCPCGNPGAPWRGCGNSLVAVGAALRGSGIARVGTDSFLLEGSGMPANALALYFQGTARSNGGAGTVFGDGLRCVAGSVVRLGTKTSSGGASAFGAPVGDTPISVRGLVPPTGGAFHYQAWYRNTAVFCSASTFNLTNALRVVWIP